METKPTSPATVPLLSFSAKHPTTSQQPRFSPTITVPFSMEPQSQSQSQSILPLMDAIEDSSSVWDLSYLLDFNLDDDDDLPLPLNLDNKTSLLPPVPEPQPEPEPESEPAPNPNPNPLDIIPNDKIRKRDPRLACSNFLAGVVPCACPELDAALEEEERLHGKKRVRTARASASARCQVPDCHVDISELKGYHRRHRVCLRCANAATVLLHGEAKRYCQQCGKFHVLLDFDEGKRSCRRKLERHNTRRRRKPVDSTVVANHELQTVTQNENSNCDVEAGRDYSNLSSENMEKSVSPDQEEEPVAIQSSTPDTQNINTDSVVSFVASAQTQLNGGKDVSNVSKSSSDCENKNAYSSMCQTGRISFKLYDWNPAEFPRRLRHQIFQWLSSMPVELEGYIRPGCTILTIFIAMPSIMWINLLKDPLYYVHALVAPRKMLSGRGNALIHLNDMIFRVMKDGSSVTKVEVNIQAPKLHYIHPTCFEAGKPMEFFACGSNLLQPKFRLLISFYGKYLKYESCVASPHNWSEDNTSCAFDNQLYKICVPHMEESLFGPAFIEVDNESGLSNFIPVLIGDRETCTEMKTLQQKLNQSLLSKQFQSASGGSICSSCEAFAHIHTSSADLLVDIAWLLKDPTEDFDRIMTASQIQRYCYLLDFLICNDSTIILGKILPNLIVWTESMKSNVSDVEMAQLQIYMHNAGDAICQKHQKGGGIMLHSNMEGFKPGQSCSQDNMLSVVEANSQGFLLAADAELGFLRSPTSDDKNVKMPLLKRDIIMSVEDLPKRYGRRHLARGSSRSAIFVVVSVAVCLAVCVSIIHPGRVGVLAVSIRRCLFNH